MIPSGFAGFFQSFIKANEKVVLIQEESEQKIVKTIEDEGLSVDRFNEILESRQNPEKKIDTSPEEITSFNSAAQVIISENRKTEEQMIILIEQEGIDVGTYQEIMIAYQQNPEIQKKVNDLLGNDN